MAIVRATSRSNTPSRHPPAPSHFLSKRPGGDFPPPRPISPPAGTFSDQPSSDTFPCRLIARQSLSGSVQWRCIRNGSGDVQAAFHVFRPNHCRYTAKHYALSNKLKQFPANLARISSAPAPKVKPRMRQFARRCASSTRAPRLSCLTQPPRDLPIPSPAARSGEGNRERSSIRPMVIIPRCAHQSQPKVSLLMRDKAVRFWRLGGVAKW